jgi:hypothetical protein
MCVDVPCPFLSVPSLIPTYLRLSTAHSTHTHIYKTQERPDDDENNSSSSSSSSSSSRRRFHPILPLKERVKTSPLYLAARGGHAAAVGALLMKVGVAKAVGVGEGEEGGDDAMVVREEVRAALMVAARKGHVEVCWVWVWV